MCYFFFAPIAQLDRALDYGSRGWGFDSLWAYQIDTKLGKIRVKNKERT